MTVQTQAPARYGMRVLLILAAAAALVLAMAISVRPVAAGDAATLNPDHVGTDSSEASDGEDCSKEGEDAPGAGEVLWHFILNGVDSTEAITGHFDFDPNSQDQVVDSSKWNPEGSTHHFYVYTDGDAELKGAWAEWYGEYNNFNLSHICHGPDATPTPTPEGSQSEGTPTPTPEGSQSEGTPTPTPEGSQAGGTGTPEGSLQDSATSLPGMAGPLATIIFGLVLLGSLGALAYANVSAVRRRG